MIPERPERSPVLRLLGQVVLAFFGFFALMAFFGLFVLGVGMGIGAALGGDDASADLVDGQWVHVDGERSSGNRLLALPVEGLILGSPPRDGAFDFNPFGFSLTYGYALKERLKEAAEDESIKGVLLHLRTPGGTIFGSRAIHDGVAAFRATGRPVVAWIEGLSASGGVMSMVAANAVYADHGSLIGSIGVLGPALIYFDQPVATDGGLLGGGIETRGGIEQFLIYTGRGKDLGNPFRRPTPEELSILQQGTDREYRDFVALVAAGREIEEKTIREVMGAHIFDNETAEGLGLIDGTRNRGQAIEELAILAELGEDYQLVRPKVHGGGFWQLMTARLLGESPRAGRGEPLRAGRPAVLHELCAAAVHMPLVYYGDVAKICG